MMKRILQISLRADPLSPLDGGDAGGQQVIVRQMGRNLQHLGYAVDIMTLRQDSRLPERYSFGHLGQVIRLPGWEGKLASDEDWHANRQAIADQALNWIRDQQRDYYVVHSHFWISGMVASYLAQDLQIPWIHSPYKMGRWVVRPGDQVSVSRLEMESQLLEQAQGVIVPYLKESEMIHQTAPKVPIYVIPPGVDITNFFVRDSGPLMRGLNLSKPPILYVGRLTSGRGIVELLEVMSQSSLPPDLTLVIIGGSPGDVKEGVPTDPRLRALADKLGPSVRFLGPMPHHAVAMYMGSSIVLVAPNQGPTLGMAVIEAMASGSAVVGTNVPGVADWIEPNVTGRVVEPSRVDQLWQNALELWQTSNRARQMGVQAQEMIQRHHTVNHMAQRLHAVYEEVQSGGRHQAGVGY